KRARCGGNLLVARHGSGHAREVAAVVGALLAVAVLARLASADTLAAPLGTTDATNAINSAIAGLSNALVTGSSAQREGGTLELAPGKYRIGGPGAMAACVGGSLDGASCTQDSDCGQPTSTETSESYCCWLTTHGRPVQLVGAGRMATELLVAAGKP